MEDQLNNRNIEQIIWLIKVVSMNVAPVIYRYTYVRTSLRLETKPSPVFQKGKIQLCILVHIPL